MVWSTPLPLLRLSKVVRHLDLPIGLEVYFFGCQRQIDSRPRCVCSMRQGLVVNRFTDWRSSYPATSKVRLSSTNVISAMKSTFSLYFIATLRWRVSHNCQSPINPQMSSRKQKAVCITFTQPSSSPEAIIDSLIVSSEFNASEWAFDFLSTTFPVDVFTTWRDLSRDAV